VDETHSPAPAKARVVAVVGTNASGKSSLGVALARAFDGEVVSADSRQVYRGLELGAGKLTRDEMAGVPHHMLDVVDVMDRYSLADYQAQAYAAIDGIAARGRLPIVVGGTGLYVDAVLDGYELVAATPDEARRTRLEGATTAELVDLLRERDPDALEHLDAGNRRRLIRAIEIAEAGYAYRDTRRRSPRYRTLKLGLAWPKPVLHDRISARLASRIEAGMIDEGRRLLRSGVTAERLEELGLEYRYIARYVRGEYDSEDAFRADLERAIRRFARRQVAWFKRDPEIVWLEPERGDHAAAAHRLVEELLAT
jgi:tRNA dimethylallyltransferase